MIPGVAAQPLGRRTSDSGPAITNSWSLNFLTGTYLKNGSPVALSDICDKPERVGVNGLEILDNDTDGSVLMLGDLLADMVVAGWTVIVEFEKVTIGTLAELVFVCDEDVINHSIYLDVYTSMQAGDIGFSIRNASNDGEFRSGVHKAAFTRTNLLLAVSTDGSDASIDGSANTTLNPMVVATWGGLPSPRESYDAVYIRTFDLIPPVGAGGLPALTA
ncbi:hypothetical protein [Mesorhizobium sp. GbtcB19]|uniref:hypothetical protein n=1 Tax=Mesorhizobium sp. GbtcB19 TaxID=2824764 RepID=UPI001C310C49|nr:hypothetical protein [Mesorhizobium sp. GbtcB19]